MLGQEMYHMEAYVTFIPLFVGSNTPASKFSGSIVQFQWLESPVVSPPRMRKRAPRAPTSCDSERAASAFLKKLGGRSTARKSPIGEG